MHRSEVEGQSLSFWQTIPTKRLLVYDYRYGEEDAPKKWINATGLHYNKFLERLHEEFTISSSQAFVLTTTDRTVLDFDKFLKLENNNALYLLHKVGQELAAPAVEQVNYTPHYDTLIRGGEFNYNVSEGKNPLAYAIAELVDNALWATSKNTGERTIEIRLLFDETTRKNAVIVLDNGCGMNSKQLNNWAVYKLSKFSRENSKFASKEEGYVRPDPVPCSLNSDISFFGVGGKQAAFHIGKSVRMISKAASSPDVHELVVSEEEFERKEKNEEEIFSGKMLHRQAGDFSHIKKADENFLHALIVEESGKESFTAVVITGVMPNHIKFLKDNFEIWTRQLAHVYHYYIHGVSGNNWKSVSTNTDDVHKLDILITLREKPTKCPHVLNLREIDDDPQTLFINAAEDTFEFTAENDGKVDGVIRYHPFLFDRETYPKEPSAGKVDCSSASYNEEDESESEALCQARGNKPIFECFWNGRLIPYTKVTEFDWCAHSKASKVPAECYNRISGVLFTDDSFKVTTNKLTFMDLEFKLRDKSTIFSRVVNGQPRRSDIKKDFTAWLQNCHEKFDKQIKFIGFKKTIERPDPASKKRQSLWSIFSAIEWDRKVYKAGQLVKTQKTGTNFYGTVVQFLLYGEHKGNVYATGGEVEITLEPKAFYDMNKIIPISKMDRTATDEAIRKHIDSDFAKLPDKLKVDWPEGNPWPQNAVRPAGTPLGPLQIEILNKNEESLCTMPSVGQGQSKKLIVVQKLVYHGATGDQEDISFTATHSAKWNFWFKKLVVTRLGKYTVFLNAAVNEKDVTVFGGRELPWYKLNFTIKEGSAESFVIGTVISSVNVGVPFNIPLVIKDAYGHPVLPPPNLKPVLKCSGLDLSYEKVSVSGTTFTIRGVTAKGKDLNYQQPKSCPLAVTLPGMRKDTQDVNIILLPGKPHLLRVMPENNSDIIENGNTVMFSVEVHDEAGNITLNPQQIVCCQVEGHPAVRTDCSTTGVGTFKTNPINVKITKGEPQKLKVQFEMPNHKKVAPVVTELKVLPSTRVSWMELYSQDDNNLVLRNEEKIEWLAGGTLENLYYRLFDEADREVALNNEIASKIKVNWTRDANLKDLINGKLPDIQVPTQVESERFYQVSYQDQSVSISFHITPRPDEPTALKATLPTTTVMLGEILTGNICLELEDQYGNLTKTLTSTCVKHMCVDAEGLDKSAISFTWEASTRSVRVTGLRFQSGSPGSREIRFTYKSTSVAQVILKVSPGVPAQLKLISAPEKPLQVLNGHGIAKPFVVQLCDNWGHPSPDQRVVLELISSTPTLMVKTDRTSQPVNTEGKASFTVTNVSGPKGCYELLFIASFNQKPISGPSVSLTIIPDPNRPVSLTVKYDTKAKFPAGGKFPVFSVTIMSDEGCPMTSFNPADLSMFVWQEVPAAQTPPQSATELKCSKPKENEKNDCFHFRDKDIPDQAGKYTIQFLLRTLKTTDLFSHQIPINVVANQPVKLGPDIKPPTPVVSYSKDISRRTLVQDMTLRIRDSHDNPAGQDLNGKVMVYIKNSSEGNRTTLPRLDGRSNQFSLVQGKARITNLAIMENSPGEDGSSYILLFKPEVLMFPTPLTPFELSFSFYNDSDNQQKMSALTKKKDELTAAIAAYKDMFATYKDLLPLLTEQHLDANKKVAEQRDQLMRMNVKIPQPASVQDIDQLLKEKTAEADKIQRMNRRVCSLKDPFRGQQDVLGMVGHLAHVEDDGAARVISWHIRSYMDCVITNTTIAARRIYDDTRGKQQVMPLDGVRVGDNRPLPHFQGRRILFEPRGNPIYARELLIFPRDSVSCDTVFKNILGDTILIDDLDSANFYRVAVVQNGRQCPTILTRQGDRVTARGNFGGQQNKAPPLNGLQPVFGAPCPQLDTLREQIGLLSQLHQKIKKRDEAAKERDHYLMNMKSPEMMRKQQDMKEKEKQLEDIERHMSTPGRPVKRCLEYAGETSGMTAKRAK